MPYYSNHFQRFAALICTQYLSKQPFTPIVFTPIGTINFRRWQIYVIFDTFPLLSAVFYYYPLKNLTNF